jgi:hypothetical protein
MFKQLLSGETPWRINSLQICTREYWCIVSISWQERRS